MVIAGYYTEWWLWIVIGKQIIMYNRWLHRICTLSVQLYIFLRHKHQQFYVCDKIINNSDNKVLILH